MNSKFKYGMLALCLIIGFSVGRFVGPKSVETKEVEKIVYKDRVIKDEKKNIRVETRETTLPDGTKIKEVIKDRKTETHTDANRETSSEKISESKTSNKSQWSIGLYTNREFIAGTIDRRILGGLFLGVYGRSDLGRLTGPELGLGLRLEF